MFRITFVLSSIALAMPTALQAQSWQQNRTTGTRPKPISLSGIPVWLKDYKFKQDEFTFVRIKYTASGIPIRGRSWVRESWATDFPDADLALCSQFEQLTNLKTKSLVLELTDEKLPNYPFIFLCEPGYLQLTNSEVTALRTYLESGGFLMVDDFWGAEAYDNFRRELQRVFPDRLPTELPLEHEIFHCVFDLKEKPQVPAIAYALQGRNRGITWEQNAGSDTTTPHYKAIMDGRNRIMVLICHNTDLSDGWERAGDDNWYSEEFSAKKAFPMGINIVFYALTRP